MGLVMVIFIPPQVDHSARTYLIDPQGQLRITYSFGTERDVLVNSIRQVVQQG